MSVGPILEKPAGLAETAQYGASRASPGTRARAAFVADLVRARKRAA